MTSSDVVVLIMFSISGLTLKLADFSGEWGVHALGFFFAGVCGILFGVLISESEFSSAIILGIIIGTAAAGKINRPNLVFGVIVIAVTIFMAGYATPLMWFLLTVTFFAFLDEVGHDRFMGLRGLIASFFHYRCGLKLTVSLLAVLGLLPYLYAGGFLTFDLTYDAAAILISKLRIMPRLEKLNR